MGCEKECFTPRLVCVFSTSGRHRCIHGNSVHSGLCACRCGLKWDVDCVFILPGAR